MVQVINSASFSEKGKYRKENEDFIYPCDDQDRIFVLCDGMEVMGMGKSPVKLLERAYFVILKNYK